MDRGEEAAQPAVEVLLSLGSNIDPEHYLRKALDELRQHIEQDVCQARAWFMQA